MAKGDQVYVYRELLNVQGVYEHHGIDCGDGSIIHYRKPSETIEQTSIETFTRGNPTYIVEYPYGFCFIPDIVIQRAESRLGEQQYNLLFNNCEHFATWCKTGISNSKQIREFIPLISHLEASNLYEPIKQAMEGKDPRNTRQLLEDALADIKIIWDELQPKYKSAVKEVEIWDKIARQAVQQKRDDLAREALKRKRNYKQIAQDLEKQLKQLAAMTEDVLNKLLRL